MHLYRTGSLQRSITLQRSTTASAYRHRFTEEAPAFKIRPPQAHLVVADMPGCGPGCGGVFVSGGDELLSFDTPVRHTVSGNPWLSWRVA